MCHERSPTRVGRGPLLNHEIAGSSYVTMRIKKGSESVIYRSQARQSCWMRSLTMFNLCNDRLR